MKLFSGFFLLSTLFPSVVFAYTFTENLSIGSTGQAVLELQRFLNQDSYTAVAMSGPGSTGQETERFGVLTKLAVIRFQEKYRTEVLIPAGLYQGTGFVGMLTRVKMNSLQSSASTAVLPVTTVQTPKAPLVAPASVTNKVQFDQASFLQALDKVGVKQGYSRDQLLTIKDGAEKDILVQKPEEKFVDAVQKAGVPVYGLQSSFNDGQSFLKFLNTLSEFFAGKKVYALGGTPFGGRILFPFYCTCSGNWLVTLTPLPPTYVVLLTYYTGTQMYMGYNLPFTLNAVGEYTSGSQCQMYIGYSCISLPSEGQIGSGTGSSAI
ncbi:MAG: peptidoglycan-binding domain-containing protein [Patescibacteria group bacterium]